MQVEVRKRKRPDSFKPLPELTPEQDAEHSRMWRVFAHLGGYMSTREMRIVMYVYSDTMAMGREWARLTHTEFCSGYDDARGYRGGSGMSYAYVGKSIKDALHGGLIERKLADRFPCNGFFYRLSPNLEKVLHARQLKHLGLVE